MGIGMPSDGSLAFDIAAKQVDMLTARGDASQRAAQTFSPRR
jgi:hypothetical protein